MRSEVVSASNFLIGLLRINNSPLTEVQLTKFQEYMCDCMYNHYKDHWFPEKPFKGSAYRCIRINGALDPLIERASGKMGLSPDKLYKLFPSELTMWIDPLEVSYRIGENGSICILYDQRPTILSDPTPPPSPSPKSQQVLRLSSSPSPLKILSSSPPPPALHQQVFSPSKSVLPLQLLQHPPILANHATIASSKDQSMINCKESLRGSNCLESMHGIERRMFVSS